MAGAGRKVFTRERATVTDVQNYLMDQTVMVFASASARATAIPSPSDGMVTYLSDVDIFSERINGAWRDRSSNNAGTSGALVGTAPPAGTWLRAKTFYSSVTLNSNGDGTVIFPGGSFANGVLDIKVQHVSQGGPPSNLISFVPWNVGMASTSIRCYGPTGAIFGGTGVAASVRVEGW